MGYEIAQNDNTTPLTFQMFQVGNPTVGATGLSPSVTISRNGDSGFSPPAGAISEVGNGWYEVAGNSTDCSRVGPLLLHAEAAGAINADEEYFIFAPFAPGDDGGSLSGYYEDGSLAQAEADVFAADQALIKSLSGPMSVSGDAGSVTSHPITGIIAAANYLAGLAAMKTRNLGIRYSHLRPGGTVQGRRRDPYWRDGPEW